jgi:hypothetical protein
MNDLQRVNKTNVFKHNKICIVMACISNSPQAGRLVAQLKSPSRSQGPLHLGHRHLIEHGHHPEEIRESAEVL